VERTDIYDYDVFDMDGNKIGPVEGLWADEATGKPEFAAVKTGWIFGRSHLVPISEGELDETRRSIRVPFPESKIKDAPHFEADHDLSPEEESRVYDHYRLDRSLRRSPTGLPAGQAPAPGRAEARQPTREGPEIPLREERAEVGKREVEGDAIRLRKVVRTETVNEPVELEREHYEIERIPASELRAREAAGKPFEQEDILLRERHEEPVVEKHTEVTGGVRARKEVDTERENVQTELRREDVEVERGEKEEKLRGGRRDDEDRTPRI
jgi:stress response protein YsnF